MRQWDSDDALEEELGVPLGTINSHAFATDLVTPAITGACTHDEWLAKIAISLAGCFPETVAEEAARRWSEATGRVDVELLELLGFMRRQKVTVILVTNATSRLMEDLATLGIRNRFDGIVNSADHGVAKPQRRIFEIAAELASANARECMFIDDQVENVEAASSLGMVGVHFTGVASVRSAIVELSRSGAWDLRGIAIVPTSNRYSARTGHDRFSVTELINLDTDELRHLAIEAAREGFGHLDRLVSDYADGSNRFDAPGEALFIALKNQHIVGVCGLNQNPYGNSVRVGRVRRMYVSPECRCLGIGRVLLDAVINRAADSFDELVLRTNDEPAAAFYEHYGFEHVDSRPENTHAFTISRNESV